MSEVTHFISVALSTRRSYLCSRRPFVAVARITTEPPAPSFSNSDDAQLFSQVSTSPCRPIFFKRPGLDHLCLLLFPNRYLLSCGHPSFNLNSEHITGNSNAPRGTSTAAAVLRRDLFLTQYSFDRFHIICSFRYILRSVTPNSLILFPVYS